MQEWQLYQNDGAKEAQVPNGCKAKDKAIPVTGHEGP
jgi:hypothetical protein